jgi:outer membrane lipoprotein SlyB
MNTLKRPMILGALLALSLLGGCAHPDGNGAARAGAGQALSVRFAVIDSVRPVVLEGRKTPAANAAGSVTSNLGRAVLRGLRAPFGGPSASEVVGSGAASAGGAAAEEAMSRQKGVEITVKLDNGEYLAVVQADEGENFQAGERVRLLGDGRQTRVAREAAPAPPKG